MRTLNRGCFRKGWIDAKSQEIRTGNTFLEDFLHAFERAHFSAFGNYQGDTGHMEPAEAARYLWGHGSLSISRANSVGWWERMDRQTT
jgi:hypothetical protein